MNRIIQKYIAKIEAQGLACRDSILFLARDAGIFCNRPAIGREQELLAVFNEMNCSSLLFARLSEPYGSIVQEIIHLDDDVNIHGRLFPRDTETRTFLHDIPVVDAFSADMIRKALVQRKAAIIRNHGVVASGALTPEQAFIFFSSVCFTVFVKYFSDILQKLSCDALCAHDVNRLCYIWSQVIRSEQSRACLCLQAGPPACDDDIYAMISEAGRAVVAARLVDSCFGNISYSTHDTIFISQTGSSLDELAGCIDAIPLAGTSSVGITASSELTAHRRIVKITGKNAILHGHPRFSVIMSMHCEHKDCDRQNCYQNCPQRRFIGGVPVVSGEIGTGPTALLHTVPEALRQAPAAIVYGHGVFTAGHDDYREALAVLQTVERTCMEHYQTKLTDLCRNIHVR
jgi:ribulose-5-phosphate 4-epimerase/fuculose-1-phosphate aldolase